MQSGGTVAVCSCGTLSSACSRPDSSRSDTAAVVVQPAADAIEEARAAFTACVAVQRLGLVWAARRVGLAQAPANVTSGGPLLGDLNLTQLASG